MRYDVIWVGKNLAEQGVIINRSNLR